MSGWIEIKLKNSGKKWTVADMNKLAIMFDQKVSWSQIAWELQRTPSACKNRMLMIKVAYAIHYGEDNDTVMKKVERYAGAFSLKDEWEEQIQTIKYAVEFMRKFKQEHGYVPSGDVVKNNVNCDDNILAIAYNAF